MHMLKATCGVKEDTSQDWVPRRLVMELKTEMSNELELFQVLPVKRYHKTDTHPFFRCGAEGYSAARQDSEEQRTQGYR